MASSTRNVLLLVLGLFKGLLTLQFDVPAQSHNKRDSPAVPIPPELRIIVSAVGHDDAAPRRHEAVGSDITGHFAIGDVDVNGQEIIDRKERMELDGALLLAVMRPVEEAKAKGDETGIQQHDA